ncbi:MAG: phage tail protein [Actinomycetota bacterium]|nr:phage tail protein [Actinomycetota bacterium]
MSTATVSQAVPAATPCPIRLLLPAILQEDDFTLRWTGGLDHVLAPVFWALDCLDSYFDPSTSPAQFLEWLAAWVGLASYAEGPQTNLREMLLTYARDAPVRGTVAALQARLRAATGVEVEVEDSGAVTCSVTPTAAHPDSSAAHSQSNSNAEQDDSPWLVVRLIASHSQTPSHDLIDEIVAQEKPAHVLHRVVHGDQHRESQ